MTAKAALAAALATLLAALPALPAPAAALSVGVDDTVAHLPALAAVPGDVATDILLAGYLKHRVGAVAVPLSPPDLPRSDDPRIDDAMLAVIALDADIDRRHGPLPPALVERLLAAAADNAWLAAKLVELLRYDEDLQRAAVRAGAGAGSYRAPDTALFDLTIARWLRVPADHRAGPVPAVRGYAIAQRFADRVALRGDELMALCEDPDDPIRADCTRLATALAPATGLLDSAVAAELADGLAGDGLSCRRSFALRWLDAMGDEIDQAAVDAAIAAADRSVDGRYVAPQESPDYVAIVRRDGELAALRWKLAEHDVPATPPDDWHPDGVDAARVRQAGCRS